MIPIVNDVLYIGCPSSERAEVERLLGAASLSVVWAETADIALELLQRRDLPVLLDLSRGRPAVEAAGDLRSSRPATLTFAVVDARRADLAAEAVLAGVADVFSRPLVGRRVASAIERERAYASRNGSQAGHCLPLAGDLYFHSPAMREVMSAIARAAAVRAGVLVRGEDGTGRQVVARAVHALQPTAEAAFVAIDCASDDGLEATLFGSQAHESKSERRDEGSRTLERLSRQSRLFDAIGGTLYLQNLVDAPARVQARLARVLRDREAVLIETGKSIPVALRPMAGVDAAIDAAVEEGRVRDDLFRRVAAVRIDVPPLRNRRQDIPALANAQLRAICAAAGVSPKTLSGSALSLLSALPWRGNAVEMRSVLQNIVSALDERRTIALEDVLAHVRLDDASIAVSNGGTLKQARARFEREYISNVLEQHRGRISDAAKALGIQRTNLYRKMRSLRVARESR